MVIQCCVKDCGTVGNNTFHSFPKNKQIAEKWIAAAQAFHLIEKLNDNKLSSSFYKVCRRHFKESDLTKNGKGQVIVKQDCAPSLFLPNDTNVPEAMTINPPQQHNSLPADKDKSVAQPESDREFDERGNGLSTVESISENGPRAAAKNGIQIGNRSKAMNEPRSYTPNYYKRRVKVLQQKVKNSKLNDSTVLDYLKTKFNEQLMEFITMQLKNCRRSRHGRRYTPEQKSLCLAMYKQGPKSYRFNEQWCCLPTKRTLGRYSADLMFKSGVDSKVLAAVKNIVTQWHQKDKYCSIGWDEVSLDEHLDYCQSMDKIEGFVEMCMPKIPVFATHALTFMVRGIEISFKQSVGYFYTNGLSSFELVELIKLMIERVSATGLVPILSVCDTCSVNASAVNELVYPNTCQTQQTGDLLQYTVNGQRITHTYDPSHLIKVVRNNLEVKNLAHFIGERWQPGNTDYDASLQIATWDDLNHLYGIRALRRKMPKLTDEHLKPNKLKMKVSLATQLFSNTFGSLMLDCVNNGMLAADFTTTARLVLFINDLFDSVNGSVKYPVDSLKGAVTPNSIHSQFYEYALVMLENMFFVDKGTGARNNRSSVLKKFESTIRGYQEVAKTCFEAGIPKLQIRETTQDGLENFFGCVKSCNQNNKTTASQYRTGYGTMIINNITGTNSLKSNCQRDDCSALLTNLHEFLSVCKDQPNDSTLLSFPEPTSLGYDKSFVQPEADDLDSLVSFDPEDEDDGFISQNDLITHSEFNEGLNSQFLETNCDLTQHTIISNGASKICQKLLKTMSCTKCTENFELMDDNATLVSVEKLLDKLTKTISGICSHDFVKQKLLASVQEVNIHFIGCGEHVDVIDRKVKNLAVDHILLSFCNDINQILSGKITTLPDNANFIQKLALDHRMKKRGIGKFSNKFN